MNNAQKISNDDLMQFIFLKNKKKQAKNYYVNVPNIRGMT